MERGVFKVLGIAMMLFGVAAGVAASANLLLSTGGRDISAMFAYTLIGVPLGYAVMRLNSAAIALTSVTCALAGVGVATMALNSSMPLPLLLINVLFGVILISPLIVAVRWLWREWMGRDR